MLVFVTAMSTSIGNLSSTARAAENTALRLATTTSVVDTGLAAFIFPDFERACGCKVDAIAVGTGQALEIGKRGDADVVIVHARKLEDQFIADGHARERREVMYNDFIIAGPKDDPASASTAQSAAEAFKSIAVVKAPFFSRGDKSGTHTKELAIWATAGIAPGKAMPWYNALGQGIREVLLSANEKGAYTLADRGTWLSLRSKLPNLRIVFGGGSAAENPDKDLINRYAVMAVAPDKHPGVNHPLAVKFIQWLLQPETQQKIGRFGVDKFGQSLFYPCAR
ncbi:MAG: substrate-binding domain-containing protein [Verrucomicrobia bacterium]|nr:substrate-binding domain-containing protein [Verrucomicrobiota bacterium]